MERLSPVQHLSLLTTRLLRAKIYLGLSIIVPAGALGQAHAPAAASGPTVSTIVSAALTAAGLGSHLTALPSVQASGFQTKVIGASNVSSAVLLSIKPTGAIQVSVDSPAGPRIASYSVYSGKMHVPNLPDSIFDARTASLSRLIYLPALELAEINEDSKASLSASAPIAIDGHTVIIVTVTNHWPDFAPLRNSSPPLIQYYIDAGTFQIIRRDDTLEDRRDHRVTYARTVRYESFAPAGLLVLPYKVTETLANQNLATTQWSTFSITL